MEKVSRVIRYLTYQEILNINNNIIFKTQGPSETPKLINPNSLEYTIEIVKDNDLFTTLSNKAAKYAFQIIKGHVFFDGNKRTGMISAFFFLQLNNCRISQSVTDNDIVKIAESVAKGESDYLVLSSWFQSIIE